ncbi:hypothetical protein CPB83DRAFT_873443 [Crepidotus variabilis]|uniref:Uncharacterized protein n=1 Tax=Crepidotus variabilis TaxID=179855 RepID=A0A9P6ESI3_9AGAR|nr:hypothetical protein CPB83DRAFT_873443 [Crepidotus variabilis]
MSSREISPATLSIAYSLLLLILTIIGFAHPALRSRFHNTFEAIHRFLGWTAIILFTNDHPAPKIPLSKCLQKSTEFWLVVVLTASIALPWLRLRRCSVQAEVLSKHALLLLFDYGMGMNFNACLRFIRISDQPLFEWHAFATIYIPGIKGYTAVVSNAGDWTQKICVRGIPTLGVLRIVPMFRRLVIVATGSGIGPVAPHLLARQTPIKLVWTSPSVRETFGDQFAAPDALVHNTRMHGKPDMIQLAHHSYQEYVAEAVIVTSSPKLTSKLIYGLSSREIPAFAPIFDS